MDDIVWPCMKSCITSISLCDKVVFLANCLATCGQVADVAQIAFMACGWLFVACRRPLISRNVRRLIVGNDFRLIKWRLCLVRLSRKGQEFDASPIGLLRDEKPAREIDDKGKHGKRNQSNCRKRRNLRKGLAVDSIPQKIAQPLHANGNTGLEADAKQGLTP